MSSEPPPPPGPAVPPEPGMPPGPWAGSPPPATPPPAPAPPPYGYYGYPEHGVPAQPPTYGLPPAGRPPLGAVRLTGAIVCGILAALFGLVALVQVVGALAEFGDDPAYNAGRITGSLVVPGLCLLGVFLFLRRERR